ncbi:MAG: hypothetical protein KDH09_13180 [Chrysiogenetes bacterium]|nr:hypothetical protein [Chrysiogenetes bacterium]
MFALRTTIAPALLISALAITLALAPPLPAAAKLPERASTTDQGDLISATASARAALARANLITTRVLIAIDHHARDAKRMLGRLDQGLEIPTIPNARLCVRQQRLLVEYRF